MGQQPNGSILEALLDFRDEFMLQFQLAEQRSKKRFDAMDLRFDAIDTRFDAMDARFDRIELRLDRIEGPRRVDAIEAELGHGRPADA